MPERSIPWSIVGASAVFLAATSWTIGPQGDGIVESDSFIALCALLCVFMHRWPAMVRWGRYAVIWCGVWLHFAPVMLHASLGVSYMLDTCIGSIWILTMLVFSPHPGGEGVDVPQGWTYNPSSFVQRFVPAVCAGIAWMCSRFLAWYQMGYGQQLWDPVFGQGSVEVVTSALSQSFPVSDAGLGASMYAMEFFLMLHGPKNRWHTMPWCMLLLTCFVLGVGGVSALLVLLQPLVVGHYCFWCLITAFCMLLILAFSIDEIAATWQYISQVRGGRSYWDVSLWKGGEAMGTFEGKPLGMCAGVAGGVLRYMSVGVSLGVMFFPQIFGVEPGVFQDLVVLVGLWMVICAVLSFAELLRSLRWVLVGLSLVLIVLSWGGYDAMQQLGLSGLALVQLSVSWSMGKVRCRYGMWQHWIR